jgi:hypothetical protein
MSFNPAPRIHTLDERVVAADKFPRIQEAEDLMKRKRKAAKNKLIKLEEKEGKKTTSERALEKAKKELLTEASVSEYPDNAEYFKAFTVNDNPEISKFLDYDEIVYPSMFSGLSLPADSIDRLWMSGFLDRQVRDGDEAKKIAMPRFLKEQDRGAELTKEKSIKIKKKAARAMEKLRSKVEKFEEARVEKYRKPAGYDELESVVEPEIQPKKSNVLVSIDDSESVSTHVSVVSKLDKRDIYEESQSLASPRDPKDEGREEARKEREKEALIAAEREKRAAEAEAAKISSAAEEEFLKKQKADAEKAAKKKTKKKQAAHYDKFAFIKVYSGEEKRAKKQAKEVLAVVDNKAPKGDAEFFSKELEFIFETERREHEAARRVQKAWRDSRKLIPFRHAVFCMKQVQKIQKVARGMITRKWVANWFYKRADLVSKWAACYRRHRSNKYWGFKKDNEREAAILCQKTFRGWLGRRRWDHYKGSVAAGRIQCLWRGVVARSRSDRSWLDKTVVPIQVLARRMLASRSFLREKGEVHEAAGMIQCQFKAWRARKELGKRLHQREMRYREDMITMIIAEEEWCQEQLVKLAGRMSKNPIKAELEHAAQEYESLMATIYNMENDYVECLRQREILSPRAIEQGWVVELENEARTLRDNITNAKFDCIFHKALNLDILENRLETKIQEIEVMSDRRKMFADFRHQEHSERLARDFANANQESQRKRRQDIAEEKRNWAVLWIHPDGKPDKKRRPGRPWDPSVFADKDKITHHPVVDLLAHEKASEKVLKPGTDESIKSVVEQVSLQTYLGQINTYEQLIQPITQIMQNNLGGGSGQPGPENRGFGIMGLALPGALSGIGAIPKEDQGHETSNLNALGESSDSTYFDPDEFPKNGSVNELRVGFDDDFSTVERYSEYSGGSSVEDFLKEQEEAKAAKEVEVKRLNIKKLSRSRRRPPAVSIPWKLLDELDGEKSKFEKEKMYKQAAVVSAKNKRVSSTK